MDFELSADEVALAEATRSFCEGRFPMKTVRELIDEGGVRRELWKELAGTGVFGMCLAESEGGAGLAMTEAVLVFEELGRALVPGPLVASHLAAGRLSGVAEGDRVVGMVELTRTPVLVEHPTALDALLAFNARGEVVEVAAAAIPREQLPQPFDPLTPVALAGHGMGGRVVFRGREAQAFVRRATALLGAFAVGIAARTVEMGVAYAQQRYQFDRPIGSFQAVKHLLADAATRTEVARAAVHAAGVTLDDAEAGILPVALAERAVTAGKLLACDAAVANARTCLQVHGGMGFTWEVDVHLYLKRALVLASQFGTAKELSERMAGYVH